MTDRRVPRPPLAVVALAALLGTTAAWWALALWPMGADAPEWLARTREVCFGATRTGLPDAGGWILLVGEPLGMLAVLLVVFGRELHGGLARLHESRSGRLVSTVVVLATVSGLLAAAREVSTVTGAGVGEPFEVSAALPARGHAPAPPLALTDQWGGHTRLDDFRGRWTLVTFAFGHCEDICPVIVQNATRARNDARVEAVSLLVVTLDPWRDTPERLPSLAAAWALGPQDRALGGSIDEVTAALDAWSIPRQRDPDTGDVAHGSTIVVIDPDGRVAWRLDGAPQRIREALAIVARDSGPAPRTR